MAESGESRIVLKFVRVEMACRFVVALACLGFGNPALSLDSRTLDGRVLVERAVDLVGDKQYSLARTYLAPALIDPFLTSGERSRAYYIRGFSFEMDGMPVSARKDYNRALEFNPENPAVLVELALLHALGRGTNKDEQLAFSLYEQAAQLEYAPGYLHLGRAYLRGAGVDKDVSTARDWLTKAAQQNSVRAMLALGDSYRQSHTAKPEPKIAEAWYRKAHAAGEVRGLLSIGYMQREGEFGQRHADLAVELFQQALDEGLASAAVALGYAYLTGSGVAKDVHKAAQMYERAALAGVPTSYVGYGYLFEHGFGVNQNFATAVAWYEKAANDGAVDAQMLLVSAYLTQQSSEARAKALWWSSRAAASGDVRAKNDYAWLLATSKFEDLRNGTLALDHATQAVEAQPNAGFLDTLAAAYAELGQFKQAIEVQNRAIDSISAEDAAIRGDLESRLAYYRRSQPWRE